MKRFLLFALTAMMSTAMFAQALTTDNADEGLLIEPADLGMDVALVADALETPVQSKRRSVDTGLYYAKPYGMMYRRYYNFNSETGGTSTYYNSQYYVPYWADFTYVNMSANPASTYWVYRSSTSAEGNTLTSDEEGNYTQSLDPGYLTYALYLYNSAGTEYYNMAYYENDGERPGQYMHQVYGSGYDDDLYWMGWTDTKSYSAVSSSYGTGYIYGPGTRTNSFTVYDAGHYGETDYRHTIDASFPINRCYENLPAPLSPLYVSSVDMLGITFGHNNNEDVTDPTYDPIRNDAELTMNIYDQDTGELLETLTATTGCWTPWGTGTNSTYGSLRYGYLSFYKMGEDPLFGLTQEPIVIDRAIRLEIVGFYNDDIDLGFRSEPIQDCDLDPGHDVAYNGFIDPSGEYEISTVSYFSNKGLALSFNGIMDAVHVAESLTWTSGGTQNGYTSLTISEDGKTCYTTGKEGTSYDFGGFYIQTALPWFAPDTNGENYYFADTPEWITGATATEYGSNKNVYKVALQAEQNTGYNRYATIYVQCKGYADATALTITQPGPLGENPDGIVSVAADATTVHSDATYNLAGQRVSDSTKGVLVRDGKKFIAK